MMRSSRQTWHVYNEYYYYRRVLVYIMHIIIIIIIVLLLYILSIYGHEILRSSIRESGLVCLAALNIMGARQNKIIIIIYCTNRTNIPIPYSARVHRYMAVWHDVNCRNGRSLRTWANSRDSYGRKILLFIAVYIRRKNCSAVCINQKTFVEYDNVYKYNVIIYCVGRIARPRQI